MDWKLSRNGAAAVSSPEATHSVSDTARMESADLGGSKGDVELGTAPSHDTTCKCFLC